MDAEMDAIQNAAMDITMDAASHVPTRDNDKNKYMEYISNKQSWLSVCIGSIKSLSPNTQIKTTFLSHGSHVIMTALFVIKMK